MSDSPQPALLDCPFCGKPPRYLPFKPGHYDQAAICDDCGFKLPPVAWNRRVPVTILAGQSNAGQQEGAFIPAAALGKPDAPAAPAPSVVLAGELERLFKHISGYGPDTWDFQVAELFRSNADTIIAALRSQDGALLDFLQEQKVDTIYLDDGRIIDVAGRIPLRDAINRLREGGA